MKQRALIIDGNSIINRAFFGIKNMATPDGFPTNALYGFLSIYQKIFDELNPQYVAVAFDLKGKTHRHLEFAEYKAGRKGMPDELAMQLPVLKEILDAMGIKRLSLQGFEADDLLGTSAVFLSGQNIETYILTGDKDALQLVNENVSVYYHGTKNKVIYTPELVKEDLGVYPSRVTDLKGLMGDSSDNIPGIPKVGKVTANKLLAQFENVEEIISQSEEIKSKRIRELVNTYAEQAMLSKKLATISSAVPVELELDDFIIELADAERLVALLQKYRLHVFLQKYSNANSELLSQNHISVKSFATVEKSEQVQEKVKLFDFNKPNFYMAIYDKETIVEDRLLYLGLANQQGDIVVYYDEALPVLIEILKTESIKNPLKVMGDDTKVALLILERYGIKNIEAVYDSQIAMYLIDANRSNYALSGLSLDILGNAITSLEELKGKGAKEKPYSELDTESVLDYIKAHLTASVSLYNPLIEKLKENDLMALFDDVEMPLVNILSHMEYVGFNVNPAVLDELNHSLSAQIETLEREIYDLAGREFNVKSPKQLGVILFEELGLPVIKKTKTGYSTSHDVLLKLAKKHPIIDKIMEYRTYTKLRSTYVEGLAAVINPITNRIHSSLNQTVAATGRLSSKEPNLQNIPVKLELGRELRKVFVASEGCILVDADYSQIELRVLAHMSDDEILKKAYTEDIDIHALTASQVFDTPLDEVTPTLRSRAKEVNFGIVYGMSDFGLSETLKTTRATAKSYIDNYFLKYPKVKQFMKDCVEECKQLGYTTTLLGRKRFIPEIKNKNYNVRQYGERMAMNTPIQGSAADIIKLAMVRVAKALKEEKLKSQLILQVHDELIIDTYPEESLQVQALLEKAMTEAYELVVPLKIDMSSGLSWYDAK